MVGESPGNISDKRVCLGFVQFTHRLHHDRLASMMGEKEEANRRIEQMRLGMSTEKFSTVGKST